MARILVLSDDGKIAAEITTDDEGETWYSCLYCAQQGTDRGHFEDTVQDAEVHVDLRCPTINS